MHDSCQYQPASVTGTIRAPATGASDMPWSKLILRLGAVTIALILIWRGALGLLGGSYEPARHLLGGAIISAAVLAVVFLALRADRLSWRTIGHHAAVANLRA